METIIGLISLGIYIWLLVTFKQMAQDIRNITEDLKAIKYHLKEKPDTRH